jgi:hypothetical protein
MQLTRAVRKVGNYEQEDNLLRNSFAILQDEDSEGAELFMMNLDLLVPCPIPVDSAGLFWLNATFSQASILFVNHVFHAIYITRHSHIYVQGEAKVLSLLKEAIYLE